MQHLRLTLRQRPHGAGHAWPALNGCCGSHGRHGRASGDHVRQLCRRGPFGGVPLVFFLVLVLGHNLSRSGECVVGQRRRRRGVGDGVGRGSRSSAGVGAASRAGQRGLERRKGRLALLAAGADHGQRRGRLLQVGAVAISPSFAIAGGWPGGQVEGCWTEERARGGGVCRRHAAF